MGNVTPEPQGLQSYSVVDCILCLNPATLAGPPDTTRLLRCNRLNLEPCALNLVPCLTFFCYGRQAFIGCGDGFIQHFVGKSGSKEPAFER